MDKLFFAERKEAGDRLCSLHHNGDELVIEEVVAAAGLNITSLEPDVENVKKDEEISLYLLDDRGRLHKVRRADKEWVHTIQDLHAKLKQP